jgi:hypothetical protein
MDIGQCGALAGPVPGQLASEARTSIDRPTGFVTPRLGPRELDLDLGAKKMSLVVLGNSVQGRLCLFEFLETDAAAEKGQASDACQTVRVYWTKEASSWSKRRDDESEHNRAQQIGLPLSNVKDLER